MFSYIKIEDFCNLTNFEMEFENKKDTISNINLNVLIGKNGTGKSCLLDALFEIGTNNLKSKESEEDATSFKYQIKIKTENGTKTLCAKPNIKNTEMVDEPKKFLWDKIFRLYTGSTKRYSSDFSQNIMDFNEKNIKYILPAIFFTSYGTNLTKYTEDSNIKDILKLTSGCNINDDCESTINPVVVWLEINIDEGYTLDDVIKILNIKQPDYKSIEKNSIKCFWKIDKDITTNVQNKPLNILYTMLEAPHIVDAGFLYEKSEKPGLYYTEQSLSDGELGVFSRLALLIILGIENKNVETPEKYLILLDEPETHFNENWKIHFINLIDKIFSNAKVQHDIFIATHSAMLVTDLKKEELHRLYKTQHGGVKATTIPFCTFGGNVIDIGRTLFEMDSDIGERAKDEIKEALNNDNVEKLNKLLHQVGAGEWRWKIRSKINQLEKADMCCNFKIKDPELENEK